MTLSGAVLLSHSFLEGHTSKDRIYIYIHMYVFVMSALQKDTFLFWVFDGICKSVIVFTCLACIYCVYMDVHLQSSAYVY